MAVSPVLGDRPLALAGRFCAGSILLWGLIHAAQSGRLLHLSVWTTSRVEITLRITTISDAILPTLIIFKWCVKDFLGCRMAGWDGVFSTAFIHTGGATADSLGTATSLAALLSLYITVRSTSIDCALCSLKLTRSDFIRRNGLCLLKWLSLLCLFTLRLAFEALILRLGAVAEIMVSSLHQSVLTYGVHFLESFMAEGALLRRSLILLCLTVWSAASTSLTVTLIHLGGQLLRQALLTPLQVLECIAFVFRVFPRGRPSLSGRLARLIWTLLQSWILSPF